MAVAAYFPFGGTKVTINGVQVTQDWAWAMTQWDRITAAGNAVRLVLADQSYCFPVNITDMTNKLTACKTAGQLVFGYVYGAGGKIPLGPTGQTYPDPITGKPIKCVQDQIDAWQKLYGNQLDGIYVDVGPSVCCDPAVTAPAIPKDLNIPTNYQGYVTHIQGYGYLTYLLTPQYPDNIPGNPWLQNLGADYLGLWEAGVNAYLNQYYALDFCAANQPGIGVPNWWDPGLYQRFSRVHIINDCAR